MVLPTLLAVAYFVLVIRSGRRPAVGTGLLAAIVIAQVVYMVAVGGDSYELSFADRYLAPLVPMLFVLAVLGAFEVARALRTARRPLMIIGSAVLAGSILTLAAWLPVTDLQQPAAVRWHVTPWIVLLGSIGVLMILVSFSTWARSRSVWILSGAICVAAILATNAIPYGSWIRQNYQFRDLDEFVAWQGMQIYKWTPPNATIGVTGAGSLTFFDHRRSVDLLGYSDHTIATSPPHTNAAVLPGPRQMGLCLQHRQASPGRGDGALRPDPDRCARHVRLGISDVHIRVPGSDHLLPARLVPSEMNGPTRGSHTISSHPLGSWGAR